MLLQSLIQLADSLPNAHCAVLCIVDGLCRLQRVLNMCWYVLAWLLSTYRRWRLYLFAEATASCPGHLTYSPCFVPRHLNVTDVHAGDGLYYNNVNTYYERHLNSEDDADADLITDWDNLFWASNVLLANVTGSGAFHQATQSFLKQWVCGTGGTVQ